MGSDNHDFPDGDPYDEEESTDTVARRRWPLAVALVVVALAVVGGGIAVAANMGAAKPAPSAASTATEAAATASAAATTATPSPATAAPVAVTPSATSAPATDGTVSGVTNGRYVSASAGVSFNLPDRWTVEESTDRPADYPGTKIIVFNEARMQVAELYHGATGGVGGACGPGPYKMTELDTAPALDTPWAKARGVHFSYRVLDMRADGGAFDYQVGLVDNVSGQVKDSCMMFSFVSGAPKGTLSFADRTYQSQRNDDPIFNSLAEAEDYMRTPEYKKLKAMIVSLKMQD
ncbi:hypothetical protein E7Y32_15435 [Arthrobacter sp. UKPF54-2]|uniref:hypothetical protein n=1 Tax=Arthrobacter sp. UKPF54-2 TaxID=2600159 RepID=UPI0011B15F9B|nr:hypothetical protein [Arthrobacter sp. UKPF54-2]QDY91449.1 hypothetical protein E7Y32_15435 [Arthrobacter sp. UKPF54-2]